VTALTLSEKTILEKEGEGTHKASTFLHSDTPQLEVVARFPKTSPPTSLNGGNIGETRTAMGRSNFKILGEDSHADWFAIVNTNRLNQFNLTLDHVILQFVPPSEIKFSANGEYLAIGGRMSAAVYSTVTGKKIGPFVENQNIFSEEYLNGARPGRWDSMPHSLCVATNGKYLVTGGDNRIIKVWDLKSGEAKGVLKGHASRIVEVELSPDGKHLVSSSQDCTVIYWDLEHQIILFELSIDEGTPQSLSFSHDGTLFAGAFTYDGNAGNQVSVWNTDGKLVAKFETAMGSEFGGYPPNGFVGFSPSGNQLFATAHTGIPELWEFDSQVKENDSWRNKFPKLGEWEIWHALAWRRDGPWALSAGSYGCKAYDVMSGQPLFHLEVPSEPFSISLCYKLIEKSLTWRMLRKPRVA
jgi:WD40 repeat protein